MSAYDIVLVGFFIVVVIGVFKGVGDNRTIIVFADYDDLGLSILIPASFFLIAFVFRFFGGHPYIGMSLGACVSVWLSIILIKNTYIANGQNKAATVLAVITKIPLSVVWFIGLLNVLNPSGSGRQRVSNRAIALVILTILTPILGMLVVNKTGNLFNPRNWVKGRRVGDTIRSSL